MWPLGAQELCVREIMIESVNGEEATRDYVLLWKILNMEIWCKNQRVYLHIRMYYEGIIT